MKKTPNTRARAKRADEMRPEYDFNYSRAKPNRFAGRIAKDQTVVLLDPELSKVFPDSESVNTALRAIIAALPRKDRREARK
jgi:hypothetical protein